MDYRLIDFLTDPFIQNINGIQNNSYHKNN